MKKLIDRARHLEPNLMPDEIAGLNDTSALVTLGVARSLRALDLVYYGPDDRRLVYGERMVMVHRTELGRIVLEARRDREQLSCMPTAWTDTVMMMPRRQTERMFQ